MVSRRRRVAAKSRACGGQCSVSALPPEPGPANTGPGIRVTAVGPANVGNVARPRRVQAALRTSALATTASALMPGPISRVACVSTYTRMLFVEGYAGVRKNPFLSGE